VVSVFSTNETEMFQFRGFKQLKWFNNCNYYNKEENPGSGFTFEIFDVDVAVVGLAKQVVEVDPEALSNLDGNEADSKF
jgi:hypothetical protein